MVQFCANEECTIDANGRIKLSANLQRDFQQHTTGDVVLHCLPEGAIGLFPPDTWSQIRGPDLEPIGRFADNIAYRRQLRRFGSMSLATSISPQGRITLPERLREHAGLVAGQSALLIGCEIGVEIWSPQRWEAELSIISDHMNQKSEAAMNADLQRPGEGSS